MDGKQLLNDIEFENDFGRQPLGLGLLLKDSGMVGLGTVILAVVALPVGGALGVPLAIAVAYLGANDCKALGRQDTDTPSFQPSTAPTMLPPAQVTSGETPVLASAPLSPLEQSRGAIDLPRLLASSNSAIAMGAPRAGKGYAVAQALPFVPESCSVWLLDPKDDPKERHYWARIPANQRLAFNNLSSTRPNDTEVLDFVSQFFDAAVEQGNHLLIIDEVPALSNMMAPKAFKKMRLFRNCRVSPLHLVVC